MFNNQFFYDDMEQTGNQIRIKNKIKAKNLMTLAINFVDDDVLAEIQKVFLSMTPDEMSKFKEYLNDKKYINARFNNPKEQQIINKISRIALSAIPKDEYLRKIMEEYNDNLNKIDDLKIETTKTIDGVKVNKFIEQIDVLNDRNIELIEKVNVYRENKKKAPSAEQSEETAPPPQPLPPDQQIKKRC
jgi:hypothetical protein